VTSGKELWYLTRGSGVVALLLLTAVVLLGILASLRFRSERWPRFAVASTHRNLTLLSIVFVVLHVVTTVADGYAPIGLKDAIVPFASPYRPIWLGLGAVAFDLVLGLAVTSYLRHRIGFGTWRLIHWLAFVSWPFALAHSLGTGSDARVSWLQALGIASLVVVALAVLVRAVAANVGAPVRATAASAAIVVPVVLVLWYQQGPARSGWAARAGTPAQLRASVRARASRTQTVLTQAPAPPQSFTANVSGTVENVQEADGRVRVVISLRLDGAPGGALRIDLRGVPTGAGVSMDASGVSFVPATTRAVYLGSVTQLEGNLVDARVRDAAGDRLDLTVALALDAASGAASGTVQAVALPGGSG